MGHNPETAIRPEALQNRPGSQGMQLHAPVAFWYVPTGHSVQVGGCPVQYDPGGHERTPESTPSEGSGCTDVVIEMPPVTLAPLLPIVKPLMVTTKGELSMSAADVFKTIEVESVLLQATARFVTLAAPA